LHCSDIEIEVFMPIPEFVKALVEKKLAEYCEAKIHPSVRDKLKLLFRFKGNSVELYEKRPYFRQTGEWVESPVAKFRYNQTVHEWTLYYRDRNCRWHIFDLVKPDKSFENLLKEVEKDSTGIFWG